MIVVPVATLEGFAQSRETRPNWTPPPPKENCSFVYLCQTIPVILKNSPFAPLTPTPASVPLRSNTLHSSSRPAPIGLHLLPTH